jgi:hypothetical protein
MHFSNPARVIPPKLFCISSIVGLNKDGCLSSSHVRRFEYFADCAGKFVRLYSVRVVPGRPESKPFINY